MWTYFTDPVLRAPTLGCMLMSVVAALVGVIVFLRKQSLIGEALSHATYPGIILGVLLGSFFITDDHADLTFSIVILIGAFSTAFVGLWALHQLSNRLAVPKDAALCCLLSLFFGIGLTLASQVQFTHTTLYQQAQSYLYGQAATMTDAHVVIYLFFSLLMIAMIGFFYKELQVMLLDPSYAKTVGIPVKMIHGLIYFLVVLAVVVGIRSVGVVLISAMLIAPPVAARQYTNKLSVMFVLAAIFGMMSGFLGNYLSVLMTDEVTSVPTGPMIVIVATFLCLFSLLCAPKRGVLFRVGRMIRFRYRRFCENILKMMWKHPEKTLTFEKIRQHYCYHPFYLMWALRRMAHAGWVEKVDKRVYRLTADGSQKAAYIVRLHRLWEVYLVECLDMGIKRVHYDAEEMEHIITPELEKQLTELLEDPAVDPHHQPIPTHEEITGYDH